MITEKQLESVDRQTLARIMGVSIRTLDRLEGQGVIEPASRGRGGRPSLYNALTEVPAWIEWKLEQELIERRGWRA